MKKYISFPHAVFAFTVVCLLFLGYTLYSSPVQVSMAPYTLPVNNPVTTLLFIYLVLALLFLVVEIIHTSSAAKSRIEAAESQPPQLSDDMNVCEGLGCFS